MNLIPMKIQEVLKISKQNANKKKIFIFSVERFEFFILIFVYKSINNLLPNHFMQYFTRTMSILLHMMCITNFESSTLVPPAVQITYHQFSSSIVRQHLQIHWPRYSRALLIPATFLISGAWHLSLLFTRRVNLRYLLTTGQYL